jgi:hypothetical protein
MNNDLILARLAEHGAGRATPDPAFEERLYAVLAPQLRRRPRPSTPLLLVAALLGILALGAVAVAGGLVRTPSPDALLLNPAMLEPCQVLPGPGIAADEGPRTHDGDPRIGGMACGYSWDGGNNPHFQLRTEYTSEPEARALAAQLMPSSREVLIDDGTVRAWLGTVEAMEFEYVAVIGHRDPYLFVGYLRAGDKRIGVPQPPSPITDDDRARAVALVHGVVANLEALNAGEPPTFALEVSE